MLVKKHVVLFEQFFTELGYFWFDTPRFSLFYITTHQFTDPIFQSRIVFHLLHDFVDSFEQYKITIQFYIIARKDAQFPGKSFDNALKKTIDRRHCQSSVIMQ